VFGEAVRKQGRVLLLTAEDSRQILVARLRAEMDTMNLSPADRATVLDGVRIADVSGMGLRLTDVIANVVLPSETMIDALLEIAKEVKPVLIVIDPAVSFGVGESRINDAEQGLVEAARRLRNDLNCCVLYVHHSGKANAREKTLDQYSGRGGSAFADGSRMVLVLQNQTPDEFDKATGQRLESGETGLILARPKMSYCPPPGDIYIRRKGFAFNRVDVAQTSKTQRLDAAAEQVLALLIHELKEGRYHSKNTIEHADAGNMKRGDIRAALARLESAGRVELRGRPGIIQRGSRTYLHPVGSPDQNGEAITEKPETTPLASPAEKPLLGSPPYREISWRRSEPPKVIPFFIGSPKLYGEATAKRGEATAPAPVRSY
jgi:RecA-family ATPase